MFPNTTVPHDRFFVKHGHALSITFSPVLDRGIVARPLSRIYLTLKYYFKIITYLSRDYFFLIIVKNIIKATHDNIYGR